MYQRNSVYYDKVSSEFHKVFWSYKKIPLKVEPYWAKS